jgi:dephospho-CoA kinase
MDHARRFTVGLTGGIGSGKSTVAAAFEAKGVPVIDADAIAHGLTAPGGAAIEQIRSTFGARFIAVDGRMDRTLMREHVFAQPAERQRLEAILHPMIRAETARQAAAAQFPYLILMIPLLVEASRTDPHWRARFDRVLVVDCPEEVQLARVMARSALSREAAQAIMNSQATRAERLDAADDRIDNGGAAAALAPQVEALHNHYLILAGSPPPSP